MLYCKSYGKNDKNIDFIFDQESGFPFQLTFDYRLNQQA